MPPSAPRNKPIKVLSLENGLSVSVYDHTRRYFGDYYRVRVEIVCRIPLLADYFTDGEEFVAARSHLGDAVVYSRTEEQMGVPSADIERALDGLVTNFMRHSLPYISTAQFPGRVVQAEMRRASRKGARRAGF